MYKGAEVYLVQCSPKWLARHAGGTGLKDAGELQLPWIPPESIDILGELQEVGVLGAHDLSTCTRNACSAGVFNGIYESKSIPSCWQCHLQRAGWTFKSCAPDVFHVTMKPTYTKAKVKQEVRDKEDVQFK